MHETRNVGISRGDALSLLHEYIAMDNLRKHCLATEVIMKALAKKLGHNENAWGIAGLLHDLDYEETKDNPTQHGLKTAEILDAKGVDPEIIKAIKAHNAEALGISREDDISYALTCAECITGLIVATTLVYPDKKITSVKSKSILKRMKQKEFARNVSRELIKECEKINMTLEEFAELSLQAMQSIDEDLEL